MSAHWRGTGTGKTGGVTVYQSATALSAIESGPRLLPKVIDERLSQSTRLEQIPDSVLPIVIIFCAAC
jgi:hypothetical protein